MNIIEMGIQAGLCDEEGRDDNSIIIEDQLEAFAKLVAAQEREECAKLCDDIDSTSDYYGPRVELFCAEAIRARGEV